MSGEDDGSRLSNRIVGTKQVMKAIAEGKALRVYLAKDADHQIQQQIKDLCTSRKVMLEWVACKALLGKDCGIDVGAAAAADIKHLQKISRG